MEEKLVRNLQESVRSLEYALGYVRYCNTNLRNALEQAIKATKKETDLNKLIELAEEIAGYVNKLEY